MIFSTLGFISSHVFWFYTGTMMFIDLDLCCLCPAESVQCVNTCTE